MPRKCWTRTSSFAPAWSLQGNQLQSFSPTPVKAGIWLSMRWKSPWRTGSQHTCRQCLDWTSWLVKRTPAEVTVVDRSGCIHSKSGRPCLCQFFRINNFFVKLAKSIRPISSLCKLLLFKNVCVGEGRRRRRGPFHGVSGGLGEQRVWCTPLWWS